VTDPRPAYMDLRTLSWHISTAERTIEEWVKTGQFPPPKRVGGKRLWRWEDVDRYLAGDGNPATVADLAEQIRANTKAAVNH